MHRDRVRFDYRLDRELDRGRLTRLRAGIDGARLLDQRLLVYVDVNAEDESVALEVASVRMNDALDDAGMKWAKDSRVRRPSKLERLPDRTPEQGG
jgi:hypothetical protein